MNIFIWILFVLLNIRLLSGISDFSLFLELFSWQFMGVECYELAFFWVLLVIPLQFLILPVLYEFLSKKSQVFLFLNKLKNCKNNSLCAFESSLLPTLSAFTFSAVNSRALYQLSYWGIYIIHILLTNKIIYYILFVFKSFMKKNKKV